MFPHFADEVSEVCDRVCAVGAVQSVGATERWVGSAKRLQAVGYCPKSSPVSFVGYTQLHRMLGSQPGSCLSKTRIITVSTQTLTVLLLPARFA